MTSEKLKAGKALELMIRDLQHALNDFDDCNRNVYELPDEMWDRHTAEVLGWLKNEMVKLESEFDAL